MNDNRNWQDVLEDAGYPRGTFDGVERIVLWVLAIIAALVIAWITFRW